MSNAIAACALETLMAFTSEISVTVAAGQSFITALRPAAAIVAGVVASTGVSLAQGSRAEAVTYCAELKELNNYAMSRQRFAPIIGQPRSGNYRETSLPLTGWTNCAFYGTAAYTCDSAELKSHEETAKAQQRIAQEILSCFDGTWAEAPDQMSPGFVVLHPKLGPASITLNLDETDTKTHIVRLILFLRR
jgi:hypothetical protein